MLKEKLLDSFSLADVDASTASWFKSF